MDTVINIENKAFKEINIVEESFEVIKIKGVEKVWIKAVVLKNGLIFLNTVWVLDYRINKGLLRVEVLTSVRLVVLRREDFRFGRTDLRVAFSDDCKADMDEDINVIACIRITLGRNDLAIV